MLNGVDISTLIAAITAYGATITKVVDAIRKFDRDNVWPKAVWNTLPLGLGILFCVVFDVNILSEDDSALSRVLTGLAIGASASGWHEVFDALSGAAKVGKATAESATRKLDAS